MIAVDQTFVGNGDAGAVPGNCVQAAFASLLELPLELVPHFGLFPTPEWGDAVLSWLRGRGKKLRIYNDWPEHIEWWEVRGVDQASALEYAPSNQMMLATGHSNSGPWGHTVVWKAGELVHDPNPLRLGLKGAPYELWQVTDL